MGEARASKYIYIYANCHTRSRTHKHPHPPFFIENVLAMIVARSLLFIIELINRNALTVEAFLFAFWKIEFFVCEKEEQILLF